MGKIKISSWLWIWSLWRLTRCDHPASPRYNTLERCCGSKETTAVQTEHLMSYCHHERHKHSFTALSCQLLWVHRWWISQIFLSVSSSTQSVFPSLLRNNSISVISRQPVKIRKLPSSKQSGSNSLRPTLLSFSATVRPVLLVWLVQPRSKVPLRLSRSNASSHWLTDVPPPCMPLLDIRKQEYLRDFLSAVMPDAYDNEGHSNDDSDDDSSNGSIWETVQRSLPCKDSHW